MQTLSSFNRTEHLQIKKSLDSLNTIPGNLENQVVNQLVSVMSSFPVFILFIFHQCFQWLLLLGKQIFGSIYLRKVASPVDPWVRKIPWRGKWQPTPVFFPGKSQGGLQSKGLQRSRTHPSDWIITNLRKTYKTLAAVKPISKDFQKNSDQTASMKFLDF